MKSPVSIITLAGFSLSLLLAVSVFAQEEIRLGAAQPKITTASAVRVRNAPQVAAQETMRLKLGTVVNAVARSADKFESGGKQDWWYRIQMPGGESGWVFGGLMTEYDPARREEISRRIIDERLKAEGLSFDDGIDLYNFTSGALAEAGDANARAEFELLRLLALSRSVMSIPFDERERPPYRDWYKVHEQEIVYSEPSGTWLVRSELFWNLELKYRKLPVAERIAWEAAQNPQPGECEGDEVCHFLYLNDTEGKYLSLYPKGAHAAEALKNIAQSLASDGVESMLNNKSKDKYVVEQRAQLRKALAELRATVQKTSGSEKAAALKALTRLAPAGQ